MISSSSAVTSSRKVIGGGWTAEFSPPNGTSPSTATFLTLLAFVRVCPFEPLGCVDRARSGSNAAADRSLERVPASLLWSTAAASESVIAASRLAAVSFDNSTMGPAVSLSGRLCAGGASAGATGGVCGLSVVVSGTLSGSFATRPRDASSTRYFHGDFIVWRHPEQLLRHPCWFLERPARMR